MELRQLSYFVAIVDHGSLTKAAEHVYVAQPALSQQLALLESELRTELLVRRPRGVSLTESGRVLYGWARKILGEVDMAQNEILHPGLSGSGTVTIGLPPTMTGMVGVPLFRLVCERNPSIHLQIRVNPAEQLSEFLADGRLDMCITYRDHRPAGGHVRGLLEESFFVVGELPNGVESEDHCPIAALSGVPMILPGHSKASSRTLVERVFERAKSELNVIADIDSATCLVRCAAEGLACTIVPWSALPHGFADTHPVRLLTEPGIRRPVGLAISALLPQTPMVQDMVGMIVETVTTLVRDGQWQGAELRTAHEEDATLVV